MQAQERQAHVTAWQSSGLTKAGYARAHGLNVKTFSRWCRQQQQPSNPAPALLPVTLKSADTSLSSPIRLCLNSGSVLEMPVDISPRWLAELLQCQV